MKKTTPTSIDSLRQQAEEILKSRLPITGASLSETETLKLIYELQLHQIELELRHEELLKTRELEIRHENEGKYRYMFANNPQPMWIFDQQTLAFLEVNDAAIHHYEYTRDEFLSMTLKDIRPEEEVESMIKEVERTQKTYNPAKEWRHKKKNGEIIDVEIISHPITYEGRIARHVMVNDITRRKLTEEALIKSEERSRNALDHLLEGCQIIGFDWRYIYLNHTAEIHNKRLKDELLGQRYMDMWPGIEATEVFKVIRQTLEEQVSSHFENEFAFPDGSCGWFDLSIQPVPEGVFILSIDITERKKIENALRENEEKYRLIADNSDDWIYWVAPDGQFKYVSPACERVTGYSPEEFTSHPELTHQIVFEADREKVSQHTRISKLDDTPHNLEFRIVTKTGEIRWINHSCSPIFSDEGEYLGRRGTNRNITERKLQEEQLYESEFRFNKLYENGPFGMVMADKEFRFKKANSAFCEIIGYTEVELQQLTFKDVTHPDDTPKDLANVRKLMNKEISVYKTEKRYIRKDRQAIWGALTVTPNYDSEGQFLYYLGIIEDISRRKQAEENLRERENKLGTILTLLPVGISILDLDQEIVYENPALENILGITMEGLSQGDYRERKYLRGDGTPKPAEEFASVRAFNEKKAFQNIVTGVVKEDGHTVWTNVSAVPVEFPDWKVVLVTADITSLKQIEDALKKSKQLLSETESIGRVGGWEFNMDTKEQTWTEEVYRIHEVDLDFNQNVDNGINFYTPASRPIIEKAVRRVIEFGEPFDLELEIVTAKGNLRKVHTIGKADLGNRRVYGFFQDITERKLAEEEIIRLNERISTATRASQVGIWDWNVKDNILTWDDQMYALYGVKKEEFAGAYEAWVSGLHPDDKELGTKQTQLALNGDKEYDTEFRVIWPDGTIRYCKARGEVFRNEKGEPVRMVGINYDVTQQKLIEKELQESEEYLKLGYDTANLGIWKNDLNTMTVEFDERARSHYGFEESVVMLSDVIDRIHPDDKGRLVAEIEKATSPSGTGRYSTEYRVIHPDGSVHWLYIGVRVTFDSEGENRRSVMGFGTSLDITERKRAEEALRESEEKFRNLIESLPLPVTYVNREGEIVFRNDRFLQVMGYSRKEVPTVNEWWGKAYPNEKYRKQVVQQWGMAVENARANDTDIEPTEYKITCKDGVERTMIVSGILIEDNLLITFIDITDRKKAEEEVRKLNETLEQRVEDRTKQLKEANQELEAFSYSVSHDLRAPLRHINGFVDLLTENYNDLLPEKGKHYLSIIVNSSRHMGTLIDDLLQFSRTGRQEMQKTKLDMNVVVQEVLKLAKQDIHGRNIEWNISALPILTGDHSLLRMVWFNLLNNAIKFTKAKEPAIIQIGYREEKNEHVFFVRDNGAGFDMRFAHKLFGVFQRLHSTQEFEGTGIGLANVRRIILKHGGRTWAESQLKQGATFYFTLPKPK